MNREIKFRGWHEGHKASKMISAVPAQMIYEKKVGDVLRWFGDGQPIHPLQYTCLKDANDVEIYEGDVVKVEYGIGKVVFNCGMFMIEWIEDKEANMEALAFSNNNYKYGRLRDDLEVIGNIYEHTNLLNQ